MNMEGIRMLQYLASKLRKFIFANKPVEEKGRGYICGTYKKLFFLKSPAVSASRTHFLEPYCVDGLDLLLCRTHPDDIKDIRRDLLSCMDKYVKKALDKMDRASST